MQSSDQALPDKTGSNISPTQQPIAPNFQKADGTFLDPDSLFELCAREINKHMRCEHVIHCHKKFYSLTPILPKSIVQYLLDRYYSHSLSRILKINKFPPKLYRDEQLLAHMTRHHPRCVILNEFEKK